MINSISIKSNHYQDRVKESSTASCSNSWKNTGQAILLFIPLALTAIAVGGMAASLTVSAENAPDLSSISSVTSFSNVTTNAIFANATLLPTIPVIMGAAIGNFYNNQKRQFTSFSTKKNHPSFEIEDYSASLTESSSVNISDSKKTSDLSSKSIEIKTKQPNPNTFNPTRPLIFAEEYNLNFLWINLNPQDRIKNAAQNIFNNGLNLLENADWIKDPNDPCQKTSTSLTGKDLEICVEGKKTFIYRLSKWAEKNPEAQMHLWYDSALVTHQAQSKTFEMLQAIAKSRSVNLKFRDIRKLSNVQGELANALHPGAPLYFRVDLLKAMIADHLMSDSKETAKYLVISDIDVIPMSSEELFDQRTLDYLSTKGYVFHRAGFRLENSFYIFNKEIPDLREIHNQEILQSVTKSIKLLRSHPLDRWIPWEYKMNSEFVFSQYHHFRQKMGEEWVEDINAPRKVVQAPVSQFAYPKSFGECDHQSEIFRFIGANDNTPYTINGRRCISDRYYYYLEAPIESLKNWQSEPLEDLTSS